jgi:hypothetical protein
MIVLQPESPVLITESRRGYVRVAAWSREKQELVDVGWVPMSEYEGWTMTPYNWEKLSASDSE